MIERAAVVVLLLAGAPVPCFAQTAASTKSAPTVAKAAPVVVQEPRDIADSIYKTAAADLRKPGHNSPFDSRLIRETYFSKSFDVAITAAETKAAHDGTAALTFDPISASPDAELKKVTLKTDVLELGHAVVSASFVSHGQPTVVTYDFIKEDGAWKIDDIKGTTEKEAWSVRKILKNPAREPKALPGMKDAAKAPDADVKVQPPKRPDDKVLQPR